MYILETQTKKSERKSGHVFVGVAVVTWNNKSIIGECLKSIQQQTYPNIKTIVLDNNSSDGTADLIEQEFQWVRLIRSPENTGFALGNNIIVNEFLNDKTVAYIVLLNSDATLDSHWVEKLVKFAQGKERTAFLQGITVDYYDHDIVDSTHIFINRNGQAVQAAYRTPRKEITKNVQKVFGVNAAACMITRQFLEHQPFDYLFDEDFFMYLEDADVAVRSVILGWDNYFVPEAVAYHMGSASSGKNPGFSVYMVNRNLLPLLVKNLPLSIIFRIAPRMLVADAREIYRIAQGRNYRIIYKYLSGRIRGIFTIPRYTKKAKLLSRSRQIKGGKIWELMKTGIRPCL